MSPIQQMLLGVGAVATKTYVDDIFSTFLYTGTNATLAINNGIDLATEGGMVVSKSRSNANAWNCWDTERGVRKFIKWEGTNAEQTSSANTGLTGFNTNGFTLGANYNTENWDGGNGGTPYTYTSNSFRKSPGFFDVVTYTGNAAWPERQISHNLSAIPGCIMIKNLSSSSDWYVYHVGADFINPQYYALKLNETDAKNNTADAQYWNNTLPTSTQFTVGNDSGNRPNNIDGDNYVAYLFAGGRSDSALARSVDFDGSGDYLLTGSSSDFTMGTGDFTVEGWFKTESYDKTFLQITDSSSGFSTSAANITLWVSSSGHYTFNAGNGEKSTSVKATKNQWEHLAYVRHNGTTSLYVNGVFVGSKADTHNYNGTYVNVGAGYASSFAYDGKISNFRVVKGTAVYTSSFRQPTEPLTNITNTKLLCCNDSSTTGSTVTPGTITANGNPQPKPSSPFDDSAAYIFGESGSESVIKNGSYVGDGTKNHDIYLGWEPSWIMIKCTNASENWLLFDVMRGIVTGGNDGKDAKLYPNTSDAEVTNTYNLEVTPTGFKLTQDQAHINVTDNTYIFTAIRRSDGYVGKPPELGTGVFTTLAGQSSGTPGFRPTDFPVDFVMHREPASGQNWYTSSRLTGTKYLFTNTTSAEATNSYAKFDYQDGYNSYSGDNSAWQGWMWKRYAGFDVVCYSGKADSAGVVEIQHVPHSLGRTPEMIWVKRRESGSGTSNWYVYHKGLNSGSSPQNNYMVLNDTNVEGGDAGIWKNTAPTSTQFTVGGAYAVNQENKKFIAMLFASVDGISSVGGYDGSSSDVTVTTGFQPRFILIKCVTDTYNWVVFDTVRGLTASGNDSTIFLNQDDAQNTNGNHNWITGLSSTGFTVSSPSGYPWINTANEKYIYYAHA